MHRQRAFDAFADDMAPFVPEPLPDPGCRLQDYLLLFALLPPTGTAQQIVAAMQSLTRKLGVHGPQQRAARLHTTVQPVWTTSDVVPGHVMRSAQAAGARAAQCLRPLALCLDHASGMRPIPPTALALRFDDSSTAALQALRRTLLRAIVQHGLGRAMAASGWAIDSRYTPHVTLVYKSQVRGSHVIAPICFTASRLVLLLSHRGLTHHEHVADWPLQGAWRGR